MRPFLFELSILGWRFALPTYGLMLAVAFLLALWLAQKEAGRAGLATDSVLDLWIAALVSGIVGAKVLLYALDFRYYLDNPRALLSGLQSAGVFYGGFIASVVTCLILVVRRGLPGWKVADVSAPSIALGQAVGRLGCFAAGCCYGRPTALPWGVTFSSEEAHRLTGVPLGVAIHPSQLYESALDFLLFGGLIFLSRRKHREGHVFLWYVLLYAFLRVAVEMTRGDPRGEILNISTSQVVAIAAGLTAALLLWRRRRIAPAG